MSNTKILPYARQSISNEDLEQVRHALSKPIITRGELVEEFERELSSYCGAAYGVAFNSGTAALMAAYYAADIGQNDRVITTPNTFVASLGVGLQQSATPILLDIERATGNIDLEQLALNINQSTSRGKTAVVPVHFAGIPVDMQAIEASIADPHTVVIEDAAHAIGSLYKDGSKVGCCAWSQMTTFSFHPTKTMTTGEGGMVMTNDPSLHHRLQLFRNNGIERTPPHLQGEPAPWYYEVVSLTGNYNFTEMQAALGLSQLKRIDLFIAKRQLLMQLYKKQLASLENVRLLSPPAGLTIAPHLCVVHIDFAAYKTTRMALMNALKERGILTQLHYIPLYRHPFFQNRAGDLSEYFPEMERHYAQALSLPLYYDLTEEEVSYVVKSLKEILFHTTRSKGK